MSHRVWRIEYRTTHDPMMPPGTRYHNAIFVETDAGGGGRIIQVGGPRGIGHSGGMEFEYKQAKRPEDSHSFHQKYYLGSIKAGDLDAVVNLIQTRCPPPPQQRNFNTKTYRTEPCKPDGSFYQPGETIPPYEKCTEWTLNKAIPTLQQSGYLDVTHHQTAPQTTPPTLPQQPQQATDWTWDAASRKYWRYILLDNKWEVEWNNQ